MKSVRSPRSRTLALAVVSFVGLMLIISLGASGVGRLLQGFEIDTSGWLNDNANQQVFRRPSGYASLGYASGIPSAAGGFHARLVPDPVDFGNCSGPCTFYGPFTYFNRTRLFDGVTTSASNVITSALGTFTNSQVGFIVVGSGIPAGATITSITNAHTAVLSQPATASALGVTLNIYPVFTKGFLTEVDVYLDTAWAATHPDARFDWDSALQDNLGYFLSDYVFNVGTQLSGDVTPGFWVSTSTNAFRDGAFPENPCPAPGTIGLDALGNSCRAPIKITTSGWYTFRHTFRIATGTQALSTELTVLDAFGAPVVDKTIFGWQGNPSIMAIGPSYGWFANQEIAELPIDNTVLRDFDAVTLSPALPPNISLNGTQTVVVSGFWETNPSALTPGLSPSDVTFTQFGGDTGTVSVAPSLVQPLDGTMSFVVTGTAVGSITLTAHVGGFNSNAISFAVMPILPTISINNMPASPIVGQSFTPTYAYIGDGITSTTSSTPATCTESGGVVTFIASSGPCTLVAHSTATVNYFAAIGPPQSVTAAAATPCTLHCYANVATGNDIAGGDTPVTAKKTIQAAVNQVSIGGTVHVAAGTYPEQVTVPKAITLLGAQNGVDARTVGRTGLPATESVVTGNAGTTPFYLTASGITLDGFTVQGNTNANIFGFGILLAGGTHRSIIVNNIVQDNIIGLGLANNSAVAADQTLIVHNVFRHNNQPGPASGTGIYTDQFVGVGTVQNVLIDANRFSGHDDAGIDFSSTDPSQSAQQITISNNTFDGEARGMLAFSFKNSSIDHNVFQNSTSSATADIRLFEGVDTISITFNTLQNGAGRAIRINNLGTGAPDATGVSFNFNAITGYSGPASTVQVESPGYNGIANGTCNWWGSASGPSGAGPGTGSSVSTNVTFLPWWSAPAGPCDGGLPTYTVTIDKYLDGVMATAAATGSTAFPMVSSWNAINLGAGSGGYTLDPLGFNSGGTPYRAVTSPMTQGASYTTNEVVSGSPVGSCASGAPFELVGYTTGTTLAAAQAGIPSATIPNFLNLTSNEFVIVWNKKCKLLTTISISNLPAGGSVGGFFTPTYAYVGDGVPSTTSLTPGTCTVSGGVVTYVGAGPCNLVAGATEGATYQAVTGTTQSFTILALVPCTLHCYANVATGSDAAGGDTPATAKKTIQAAVNQVLVNGFVHVAVGTYPELVNVNKTITVQGAKFGVDARTGRTGLPVTESVVTGPGGTTAFYVTASGVTIDGFTIQGNTSGTTFGFGLLLGAGTHKSLVVNNIIQDNIIGLGLANDSGVPADQTLLQHNLFRNNNQPGPASGTGIYTDQYVAGGLLQNVLIDANLFSGHDDAGIDFSSTDAAYPAQQITISHNTFDANGRGMLAFNLVSSSIDRNVFQNSTDAATADVRLFEGANNVTITNNTLQNGAGRAIRVNNAGTGSPDAMNVSFNFNAITGYGGPLYTAEVDNPGYNGIANGTCNWWGSASGPSGVALGLGSTVGPNIQFLPWWTAPGGPCDGGTHTYTVTIDKYINGVQATAVSASSAAFPMSATWNALNIGAGSGSFDLDADGFNGDPTPYQAITAPMTETASYSTFEVTGGPVVGSCASGAQFELLGYSSGNTLAQAQAAGPSAPIPSFTNLQGNKFVIVWNKKCVPLPTPTIKIKNIPYSAQFGGSFTVQYLYTGDGIKSTTSLTPLTCSVAGNVVNFIGVGTCTLQAHATATSNYNAADGPLQSFQITICNPTISINNLPSSGGVGGSFVPTYAYNGDGVPSTTSLTPTKCTVTGGTVNFLLPGTCSLKASATATPNSNAATGSTQSFTITPPVPFVTIANLPGLGTFGGSFTPAYSTNSNGATSVTSSTTSKCTVNGTTVKFVGVGTCTLVAHTAATSLWAAGTGAPQSFTIGQLLTPSIVINNIPGSPTFGGSFTPTYTYNGDGVKSTTSNTPSTCTVSSGVVSFVGVGQCDLVAHATGTVNVVAATGPVQSFMIGKKSTTISIKNIPSYPKKNTSFTPLFNYTGDGVTSVTSSTTSVCTVSGGVVSFVNSGTCTLTAHATAGTNYLAANGSAQTFTVKAY